MMKVFGYVIAVGAAVCAVFMFYGIVLSAATEHYLNALACLIGGLLNILVAYGALSIVDDIKRRYEK